MMQEGRSPGRRDAKRQRGWLQGKALTSFVQDLSTETTAKQMG
jgi:hypothetical protein